MNTLIDDLASEAGRLVHRTLGAHKISQIWTERDRILFRLQDGRTGDIEVLVNWDCGSVAHRAGRVDVPWRRD